MSYNDIETDIEFLRALLNGNHLSDNELERANELLGLMKVEIKHRCWKGIKE